MAKIVSMSSGAIDPINVTKRVFWRPVTSTTVLKVGQPVCYNSDSVQDHKERTVDPTHLGLSQTTYSEGAQDFTGRLFIVEEPLTANLMSFAGIVKSLGPKAGADGDMIEIFMPVDGAVVPVYTDENCQVNRTLLGIHNAEVDVSYPGVPIGVAMETKDRSGTDGVVWMKFKNFIYDNANATLCVDDEANAANISGIYRINVEFIQTSGNCSALYVHAISSAGASSAGYGLAAYFQGDITATPATHCPIVGIWMNLTGGTPTEYLYPLEVGLYEDGATLTSTSILAVLSLTHQVADAPSANSFCWMYLDENGAETVDNFIRTKNKGDLGDEAMTADHTFDTADRCIRVRFSASSETFYIPLMNNKGD